MYNLYYGSNLVNPSLFLQIKIFPPFSTIHSAQLIMYLWTLVLWHLQIIFILEINSVTTKTFCQYFNACFGTG